ncbi:kinetochore complex Sim4 subunit Fta1-domain-containing protein [Sordaria brevicollis]|uniref:Kinetochore complex Sim4 subunit Fta1-domain-containing protein n=1 Tax=Sordaria brevicollis TaxID=83679 RepID=A0AAE0PGP9_SORBR|nr:kinetochore complex Sim4 subunit Fta1-domain-containing protein [Sordaria brevicollis]
MRIPPQEVRDQWPEPNYTNPERRPGLVIVEAIMLPVSLMFVALRMYVRARLLRKTGWDDWLMIIATIFGIAVSICVILASTTYGWDKHLYDLTIPQLSEGRQISMAIQVVFIISSSCAKVSILVSYLALAPLDSWFRRLTKYSIVFIVAMNVGSFILLFTQCTPLTSYWDIAKSNDDCIPEGFPLMAQAILTAVADFIVWVLPLPTFYKAQIPIHQRVILIVLFSFGLFVVFAACIRTYWIHYVVWQTWDPTWEGIQLWAWTAVEIHLGIMCGCVPYFKSLFRFWKGKKTSRKGSSVGKSWSGSRGGAGAGVAGGSKILTTSRVEVGVRKCVSFRSERSEEPLSPRDGGNSTLVTVDGGEEMELQEKRMIAFGLGGDGEDQRGPGAYGQSPPRTHGGHEGTWGFEFDGARGTMHSKSLSGMSFEIPDERMRYASSSTAPSSQVDSSTALQLNGSTHLPRTSLRNYDKHHPRPPQPQTNNMPPRARKRQRVESEVEPEPEARQSSTSPDRSRSSPEPEILEQEEQEVDEEDQPQPTFYNTTFSLHRVSPLYIGSQPLSRQRLDTIAQRLREVVVEDVVRGVEVGVALGRGDGEDGTGVMGRAGGLVGVDIRWVGVGGLLGVDGDGHDGEEEEYYSDGEEEDGEGEDDTGRARGSGRKGLDWKRLVEGVKGRKALSITLRYELAECTALLLPTLSSTSPQDNNQQPPSTKFTLGTQPTDPPNPSSFLHLPLLLLRMPAPLKAVITEFLSTTFDCRVSALRLGTRSLVQAWESWLSTTAGVPREGTAGQGQGQGKDVVLSMGFYIPPADNNGAGDGKETAAPEQEPLGLKSIDVIIPAGEVGGFVEAGRQILANGQPTTEGSDGKDVKKETWEMNPSKRLKLAGRLGEEGWAWRSPTPSSLPTSASPTETTEATEATEPEVTETEQPPPPSPFTEALAHYVSKHLGLNLFHPGVRVTKIACGGFVMSEGRVKVFTPGRQGEGGKEGRRRKRVGVWKLVEGLVRKAGGGRDLV